MTVFSPFMIESGAFGTYEINLSQDPKYSMKKRSQGRDFLLNEDFFIRYLKVSKSPPFLLDYAALPETPGLLSRSITPWKMNLKQYLSQDVDSPLPLGKKDVFYSLVKALKFLHEADVVHPDLSSNTIVISNENTVQIKDFDRAHFKELCHQTYLPILDFPYASPELLLNLQRSTSTPIWNLAITMIEVFTKTLPAGDSLINLFKSHQNLLQKPYPKGLVDKGKLEDVKNIFKEELEINSEESERLVKLIQANSPEKGDHLIDLLYKMLSYFKEDRPSFQAILTHPYFSEFELEENPGKKEEINFNGITKTQHLGSGSFGSVFAADLKGDSQSFAVKVGSKESLQEEDKFLRLMSRHQNADSPAVKRFASLSVKNKQMGIVLERMEIDLDKFIALKKEIPLNEIKFIVQELIKGLSALYDLNLIHLDLKPANILLSKSSVKISDFGNSFFADNISFIPSAYQQSRWYRSPESILGIGFNLSTDIWSLGAIVAELVYFRPVFRGNSEKSMIEIHQLGLKKPYPLHLMQLSRKNFKIDPLKGPSLEKSLRSILQRWPIEQANLFINFIYETFEYDFNKRPTAKDLTAHLFLKS